MTTNGVKARFSLRVLIADDDRDIAVALRTLFAGEGHEVHIALRGDEVLELDRLIRPDVVVLDINMPGMSGFAVAHEIRARRGVVEPLLIGISGQWKDQADERVAREAGFDHYLVKPLASEDLLKLVRRFGDTAGGATVTR